jgi:hypothetical protein
VSDIQDSETRDPGTDKLARALAEGQLWRAKQILSGRIGSNAFDRDLYERYGELLLRMGDDLAAGKYLFLSGHRRIEHEHAVRLFLARYSRAGWQSLVSSFPAAVRKLSWNELPQGVVDELLTLGVPRRPHEEPLWTTLRKYPRNQASWEGCLIFVLALVGIGVLISLVIVYFFGDRLSRQLPTPQ